MVVEAGETTTSNVTDATIRADFRQYVDAKDEFSLAKKRFDNVKAAITARGGDPKLLEQMHKLQGEDAQDVLDRARKFLRYCRILQAPIGTQFSLLGDQPGTLDIDEDEADAQAAWDAGKQGLNAGRNGEPADHNPHSPPGSLAFVAWEDGRQRGIQQVEEGLWAPPRPRGRPRKTMH